MSGTSVVLAMISPGTMMIILVIAVLLYGKRLPEVARTLGKGFAEFQKSLRGIEQELHSAINSSVPSSSIPSSSSSLSTDHGYHDELDGYEEATAPKFEPPPSEHQAALGEHQAEAGEHQAAPSEHQIATDERQTQAVDGSGGSVH